MSCVTIVHPEIKELLVCETEDMAIRMAGDRIIELVRKNPKARITYATGNTKIPLYKYIAKKIKGGEVDFSKTEAFHLDEYWPISKDDKDSFVNYLYKRVFGPFGIKEENIHTLNGESDIPDKVADEYNKLLANGIDLCILGIGPGGHIGFNESKAPFESVTHLANLSKKTIHRDQVERGQKTPNQALTQGIKNILEAKKIILSAFGHKNSTALHNCIYGPVNPKCPASALRMVGNKVSIIIDKESF